MDKGNEERNNDFEIQYKCLMREFNLEMKRILQFN